jgi:TPP-dependent pyruvate/acetoin dehydrogenase alpha subunit
MDPDVTARWKARDPLILMRRAIGDEDQVAAVEAEVNAELEVAVQFAKNSPEPAVDEFLSAIPD